ncbi:MAG: hypothetical protein QOJ16_1910 [Acidobacteriota bacterium]|jgi:hypothetical protein|nr:hypothetical protein [Acidobacteriota bacterium]
MVPELRRAFNESFTPDRYAALQRHLDGAVGFHIDFRVCETPLFLSGELTRDLERAAYEVVAAVTSPAYLAEAGRAVPPGLAVPGDEGLPTFLQVDFALVRDPRDPENASRIVPRLIELQAFPSLYGFQWLLERGYRSCYPALPADWTPYFGGLDEATYAERLRRVILGDCAPENVILLEIEPEKQKTRVDFVVTERLTGIAIVGVDQVTVRGREVLYEKDGRQVPVRRIYNRVIFDEATRKGLDLGPLFSRELDVTWVGHPNWFLKISKFSLPWIDSPYAPRAWFVSDLKEIPADLENYVLKPLFSFAGLGVEIGVTAERLRSLANPEHYILQRKVDYEPLVATPDGGAKAEVRMMFVWPDGEERPQLVNNLVRMSKGAMMGVDFNKDRTWIGASQAYHAPGL